jgi:hypothetical protein
VFSPVSVEPAERHAPSSTCAWSRHGQGRVVPGTVKSCGRRWTTHGVRHTRARVSVPSGSRSCAGSSCHPHEGAVSGARVRADAARAVRGVTPTSLSATPRGRGRHSRCSCQQDTAQSSPVTVASTRVGRHVSGFDPCSIGVSDTTPPSERSTLTAFVRRCLVLGRGPVCRGAV